MYFSDPAGRLMIDVKAGDALGKYRQGSKTADLLFCRNCGVMIAAVFEREATLLGSVNVRCLHESASFGRPVVVSPQKLSKEEKTARWENIWTRDVQVRISDN
jgi:hypothetical protein